MEYNKALDSSIKQEYSVWSSGHHVVSLQKVIWEIMVGDGRLCALCQTASCDGAINTLFIIINVDESQTWQMVQQSDLIGRVGK